MFLCFLCTLLLSNGLTKRESSSSSHPQTTPSDGLVLDSQPSVLKIEIKIEGKVSAAHADSRGNNGEVVTLKCSVLLNDSTRTDYSSNNLSSVAVEAEAAGTTDWSFRTVDPTTAQGLSTVYTSITIASSSNAIVNND